MSSKNLIGANQCHQEESGDSDNIITPMCSTPAVHGSRMVSPRSDALKKDSGISQVFFPHDFNGHSVVDSPISPVLADIDKTRTSPVKSKIRRSRRSCTWIGLFLSWIGLFLLAVVISYYSLQIQEYKSVVSDFFSYHFWKFLPYSCLLVIVLLSLLINLYLDRDNSQSQNEERSGYNDKDESNTATCRNSSAEVRNSENTRTSDSRTTAHRDFQCRRTFSGTGNDTWHDFKKYFGNLAVLNNWSKEQSRRTLLCSLRGQAETFAYGLPVSIQSDCDSLFFRMEQRFGIMNMKDSYIADARLRRKKKDESYREFGQAIEDLYRKAYPDNVEIVEEQAIITFLDNCHESTDFRLAVKRTRPKTLHEAVTSAVQEESLQLTERERSKHDYRSRPIYTMGGRIDRGRFNSHGRWRGGRGRGRGSGLRVQSNNARNGSESGNDGSTENHLN